MPHLSDGLLCCDATQLETFRRNMSFASSGWSDDGGDPFSKTLVTTYKITWHHDPEDHCWHLPPLWELQISNAYTLIFLVSGELRYLKVRAFCDIAPCSLIGDYMVLYPRILIVILAAMRTWNPVQVFQFCISILRLALYTMDCKVNSGFITKYTQEISALDSHSALSILCKLWLFLLRVLCQHSELWTSLLKIKLSKKNTLCRNLASTLFVHY
jgi:hypothetical protein